MSRGFSGFENHCISTLPTDLENVEPDPEFLEDEQDVDEEEEEGDDEIIELEDSSDQKPGKFVASVLNRSSNRFNYEKETLLQGTSGSVEQTPIKCLQPVEK